MAEGEAVTLQTYRQQVNNTIQQRITAHQRTIAAQHPMAMDTATRPLILLADGDSWFDYPLTGDALNPSDVIVQLGRVLEPTPFLLNLAHHGDATTEILGVSKHDRLVAMLKDPRNGRFDAILFSGGGDDLVGDQFRLWLHDAPADKDPAAALNQPALDDIIGVVKTAYEDLVATRNAIDRSIPIFVHAYDFALPTGNGVCELGPWLFPSLCSRGWMETPQDAGQLALGAQIVRLILTEFQALLQDFAVDPNNNVVLVMTQGCLGAGEWANELHPTPDGFIKIARRFVDALATRFGGRAAQRAQPLPPVALGPGDTAASG